MCVQESESNKKKRTRSPRNRRSPPRRSDFKTEQPRRSRSRSRSRSGGRTRRSEVKKKSFALQWNYFANSCCLLRILCFPFLFGNMHSRRHHQGLGAGAGKEEGVGQASPVPAAPNKVETETQTVIANEKERRTEKKRTDWERGSEGKGRVEEMVWGCDW